MEPQIQYAKTSDGVRIAYWTLGEGGTPLVYMPHTVPLSHVKLEWDIPEWRRWYENLSRNRLLVRYDQRGSGLSDRVPTDYSLNVLVSDLEAVADRLELDKFVLMSSYRSGPAAVSYAVRHPERVSRLMLWCTWANGATHMRTPGAAVFDRIFDQDWAIVTRTIASQSVGSEVAAIPWRTTYIREATSQEAYMAAFVATSGHDVASLLDQVECPTLILARKDSDGSVISDARQLASGIPDAKIAILTGDSNWPFLGNPAEVLAVIDDFLGEGKLTAIQRAATFPEGMAVILFLDIADSTALTTKLGDAAYREKERALDTSLRAAITSAAGTPIEGKVLGDGVMAVFTSARSAIDAAQRCRDLGNEAGLPLHLGIHAGDVVREVASDGRANVHGGAVQVAARVVDAAAPGEILVSDIVRGLARTSAGVEFEDRGEHELKGIPEPQRLFAVQEQA